MRRTTIGAALFAGAFAALVAAAPNQLAAQTVITGRVTSAEGQPIGGAQVRIDELNLGATTAANGAYSLTVPAERARGQAVTLLIRYIGYAPLTRQVTLAAGSMQEDFQLRADPLQLSEIVVTGVAEATELKKLPFTVGVVSTAELQATPGVTALGALTGKVAGARLLNASGEPGTAPRVRLRSATSISGTQDPLIIVDGTITRLGLADLAGEDIERIEVVKGAAASSLYGSDAANGVVQIFTRRGSTLAEGRMQVNMRTEYGASFLPKRIPQSLAHAFELDPGGSGQFWRDADGDGVGDNLVDGDRVPEADGVADNPYPVEYDHLGDFLTTGQSLSNYISIGQRSGNTNFHASFQNTLQEGIIRELDGYTRQNFRVNVDQIMSPRLDLSLGAFYSRSDNDQAVQGPGGPFFSLVFVEPHINLTDTNPDGSPYRAFIRDVTGNASNPLYELANVRNETERSRYTGNLKLRYRPVDWLTAEGSFNYDQESEVFTQDVPFGFLSASNIETDGSLFKQTANGRAINGGLTLTSIRQFGLVRNTTKASFVFEEEARDTFSLAAGSYVVKRVPNFTAVDPLQLLPESKDITIRNQNFFLISTFDIKDRYIIDGLVRRDGSSLFGADERWQTYFRVSGAWRVTQDIPINGVDELRLRASYGTAGLRPVFEAQYEQFDLAGGVPRKTTRGNPDLKPARSAETEVGFNVDFLSRFSLEYTYSNKITEDQILLVPLSAPTGYRNQWQNAGTLQGKTHELSLGVILANRPDLQWRINVAADRTRQKITKLNTQPFFVGPFYQGNEDVTDSFLIGEGETFGVIYGNRIVRTIDELYDDPAKAAASTCPTGAWCRDSVVVNEENYVVRREAWRTDGPDDDEAIDERLLLYVDPNGNSIVKIGDVNPDFNVSFSTNFAWKGLSVHGLVDWVQGGDIYNGSRQWPFFENRDRIYDQRNKPAIERKPLQYYNSFYNSIDPIDFFVESGTYVKLKELAVTYTLPAETVSRLGIGVSRLSLGVIGRNLFTITDYSGFDPEVSGLSGDPYSFRFDGFTYPNFRTFTAVVELGF